MRAPPPISVLLWGMLLAIAPVQAAYGEAASPVAVEKVSTAPLLNEIELSGTVTSPHVSQISPALPGLVSAVHFDNGAKVEAGDLLLELDPALDEIALRQAQAELAEAEADLADAYRRLKIAQSLAKRSYGPRNTVEAAETDVEKGKAAVERRKAQCASFRERIERHRIKAPFAGVISQRMAEAGEWIVPGTTAFELVDLSGLRIDIPVPQNYFARIGKESGVTIMIDAVPGVSIPGRISAVIPVSDESARTFTLRVVPNSNEVSLMPGMSARVSVSMESQEKGIAVSRDALVRHPDGKVTVWLIESDGEVNLVKERRVEVGRAFGGLVHVKSGLSEGDRVVVRGNESLREGQAVRFES